MHLCKVCQQLFASYSSLCNHKVRFNHYLDKDLTKMKPAQKNSFKSKVSDIKNSLSTYLEMAELPLEDDGARKACKRHILKDKDVNADMEGFATYLKTTEDENLEILNSCWNDVESYKDEYKKLEVHTKIPVATKQFAEYTIKELDVADSYHRYQLQAVRYEQAKRNVADPMLMFIKDVVSAMVESKKRPFSEIDSGVTTPRMRIAIDSPSV